MQALFDYYRFNMEYFLIKLGEHMSIFALSWAMAIAVGLLIAIASTRPGRMKIGNALLTVTGFSQAVPSIAVIALVFIFTGIGFRPAVLALFIYSLVPIVFNAASGLVSVSSGMKEAARGMGMTNGQILRKVELPASVPAILSGIRSAATINIGTTTIAAAIGAGGLGEIIFTGIRNFNFTIILAGAIPTAITAILVDIVLSVVEKRVTSKGLQLAEHWRE